MGGDCCGGAGNYGWGGVDRRGVKVKTSLDHTVSQNCHSLPTPILWVELGSRPLSSVIYLSHQQLPVVAAAFVLCSERIARVSNLLPSHVYSFWRVHTHTHNQHLCTRTRTRTYMHTRVTRSHAHTRAHMYTHRFTCDTARICTPPTASRAASSTLCHNRYLQE